MPDVDLFPNGTNNSTTAKARTLKWPVLKYKIYVETLVILIPKSTVDLISNKVESKFILLALIQSEMQSEALLVVD